MANKPDEQPTDSPPDERLGEKPLRKHRGSLRSKLVLSLAGIFFVFLLVDEAVRYHVVKPQLLALERAGAIRDANRVMAAMNARMEDLGSLARHWADRLAQGDGWNSAEEISTEARLGTEPWQSECSEWAAIVRENATLQWLQLGDGSAPQAGLEGLAHACQQATDGKAEGMMRATDNSLIMYSAIALGGEQSEQAEADGITPTEPHRFLVVGRTIDNDLVASLRRQTQVDFSLQPLHEPRLQRSVSVWEAGQSLLVVEFQLPGINQQPLANVFCSGSTRNHIAFL